MIDKAFQKALENSPDSKEEFKSGVVETVKEEAKSDSIFKFDPPCSLKINKSMYKSKLLDVESLPINVCGVALTIWAVVGNKVCIEKAAQPKLKQGQKFRDELSDGTEGPAMVVLPAGEFWMGSEESEKGRDSDERRHTVQIKKPFAIGQYEVTFQEYDQFCEATKCEKPSDESWGRGQRPVINVTWYDAVAYADWLSEETCERYRLPTEAEWEYAARANTETAYWWGNEVGSNNANCSGCGSQWDGKKTAVVGSFKPNNFGLFDTVGNVSEWTCSGYSSDYNGAELTCLNRNYNLTILRGGAWGDDPEWVRGAARLGIGPYFGKRYRGFRLARDL